MCHFGGGSSVTAVRDGRSMDTTMGFSPLEGVPMATEAAGGIVAWKAVSKTATWGRPGKRCRAASRPRSAGVLCSGASERSAAARQ